MSVILPGGFLVWKLQRNAILEYMYDLMYGLLYRVLYDMDQGNTVLFFVSNMMDLLVFNTVINSGSIDIYHHIAW